MKVLPIILALFTLTIGAFAQEKSLDQNKKEKLDALKIAYITETLQLTPDEAQVFWPVYNKMEAEMKSIRKARRKNRMETKQNFESMSDTQLKAAIESELSFEQQELDVKRSYNQKFLGILPVKKVALLHQAREGFKRKLLRSAREKRQ